MVSSVSVVVVVVFIVLVLASLTIDDILFLILVYVCILWHCSCLVRLVKASGKRLGNIWGIICLFFNNLLFNDLFLFFVS